MNIDLDMYQMTAVAVVVYYVGLRLKRRFNIFDQYCIPAPVIGGVLFSLLNLVMTTGGFWQLTLDTSLQGFFMTMFFTSIGYTASLRMLKEGGLSVLKLVAVCAVLIVLQNLVGIGLASVFNLGPLIGMATGSIPMVRLVPSALCLNRWERRGRRLWLLLRQPSALLWAALSAGRSPVT